MGVTLPQIYMKLELTVSFDMEKIIFCFYKKKKLIFLIILEFVPQRVSTATEVKSSIKIVFLLTLNGRALRQVKRLLKVLFSENHYYYIHVDIVSK